MSLGGVSTFTELWKRAVDISKVEKKDKKRLKELDVAVNIHTSNKPERCNHKATPAPKGHEVRSDLLPIPLPKSQVMEMIGEWFNNRTISPWTKKRELTDTQLKDLAYCVLHHSKGHSTLDHRVIRRVFHDPM